MTFQHLKDNALSYLITLVVGYGNYQLHRLTDVAERLSEKLIHTSAVVENHTYLLDQHREVLKDLQKSDSLQNISIGEINVVLQQHRLRN